MTFITGVGGDDINQLWKCQSNIRLGPSIHNETATRAKKLTLE